jgi:DNA modification methylase
VIWELPHGLTPKRRLAERHETIFVFYKGEPRHFNANAVRVPQKQPQKRAFKGERIGELSGHPLGAWPTNVWRIGNVKNNHPEKSEHPAQFPLELARRAVLLYTNPGEVVCDDFSGSGTVHAACVATRRAFIGCDLFYEDLRAKRLASVAPDLVCLLPGVTDESISVWQAEAVRVQHIPPGCTAQTALF